MSNHNEEMTLQGKEEAMPTFPAVTGVIPAPAGGWLRAGRKAQGISQQQLAEKLGFKRQAWAQLEASEAREAISLYSLRRAADAMGYDLAYYLVPRDGSSVGLAEIHPAHSGAASSAHAGGTRHDATASWSTQDLPTELR